MSIVINTLVLGTIINERIIRLIKKNQLLEGIQYYKSQVDLIRKLAINRNNEQELIELRNSILNTNSSIKRYLDLMNELELVGHPVYQIEESIRPTYRKISNVAPD